MNPAHINSNDSLQELINVDILITGDLTQQQKELYYNTWGMSFDRDFIKTLTMKDINNFLEKLIQNRSEQVKDTNKGPATFYLWYDEQSVCLCFDILSGENITLPFKGKTNVLPTPISILQAFLKDTQAEIHPLDFQNFVFLNPGDPGWDEFDDDEEEEDNSNYVQDVYIVTLPLSNISTIIKHLFS